MWVLNPKAEWSDVGYAVALTERKTLTCKRSSWLRECEARAVRFAAVASAIEAMVQESVTDGNPESRRRRVNSEAMSRRVNRTLLRQVCRKVRLLPRRT